MDPITIGVVGAAVIGGLVQAYNSEKARGASKEKLAEIERSYKALIPPDYDLSIQDPPELHAQAIQSPKFAAAVQSPNFDISAYTPEKLKEVGQLAPQLAPFIKEVTPTLIQQTETMKKGKDAQIQALDKLTKIGAGGFDPEYAQKVQQAQSGAQAQARAQQASLMDSMNRRGIGGSGLEMAAALQGNASAMNSSAQAQQQAATDAYHNQLNALSQGANIGAQLYSQDQSTQAQNANIINLFNQRMSAAQQNYEQNNANVLNQAAASNLANKQNIANQNVQNSNAAAMADRQRLDDLAKFGYTSAVQQQQIANQNAQTQYGNAVNERAYQNSIAQSLADWQNNQRLQNDARKQQMFNNEMAKTAGAAGVGQTQANSILQSAADRNQGISGITNAAVTGATMYQGQQNSADALAAEAKQRELDRQAYGTNPAAAGK